MFGVEELLQAQAHFGVLLIRDKAFEDAVLHRQPISFKEFMDFRPSPVVFDIVGYKNKLHLSPIPFFQPCSSFFFAGRTL